MEILYHKYGYRAFAFMDDNFTLSKRRIVNFADELEKQNRKPAMKKLRIVEHENARKLQKQMLKAKNKQPDGKQQQKKKP